MTPIIAKGASGVEHKLWAYPIGSHFNRLRGVYGLCRFGTDGVCYMHYIGQADDLDARVGVGIWHHHKIDRAAALGATHVAAAAIDCDKSQLCWIENDLIQGLNPPLNEIAAPNPYRVRA